VARADAPGETSGSIAVVFEAAESEAQRRLLALIEALPEIPDSRRSAAALDPSS